MNESLEPVQRNAPPPDYNVRRPYEEENQVDMEEIERSMDRPPEEGKGQFIDVLA